MSEYEVVRQSRHPMVNDVEFCTYYSVVPLRHRNLCLMPHNYHLDRGSVPEHGDLMLGMDTENSKFVLCLDLADHVC